MMVVHALQDPRHLHRDGSEGRMFSIGPPRSERLHRQLVLDAEALKPRLRGWIHLGSLPVALIAGVVLVAVSPTGLSRLGSAAFAVSGVLLFGASAAYHRGRWSPRAFLVMRRLDHCGIFVLIAGTCTAYSLILLQGAQRVTLTVIVVVGAALGILSRMRWPQAPRWVSPPLYIALGLAPALFTPALVGGARGLGGPGVVALLMAATGGVLYVVGAVVYLLQRPNPWPTSFGFHEVFHVFTILAFMCHFVGIAVVSSSLT